MQLLNPYLHFNGQCEEAFNFYAKVLGGEIIAMMPHKGTPAEEHVPAEWQNKIIHARLMVGDKLLMASDAPPDRFDQPKGFSVTVGVDTAAEASLTPSPRAGRCGCRWERPSLPNASAWSRIGSARPG